MTRTTLDIDQPVLRELKLIQRRERKSLGRLVSELLTDALARRRAQESEAPAFEWTAKPMAARIDVEDKDALYTELDGAS